MTTMLQSGTGGSRFKIDPDPPEAGQPAEVTYVGNAAEVEWQVDGQAPQKVTPDENGKFTIASVPSGTNLWLSDNQGLPGFLQRTIVDLDGK